MGAFRVKYGIIISIILIAGLWFAVSEYGKNNPLIISENTGEQFSDASVQGVADDIYDDEIVSKTDETTKKPSKQGLNEQKFVRDIIIQDVPFLSQAPFGEWDDDRFQNACEEASIIIAASWVFGESLTPESGKRKILDITAFETKRFGEFFPDTSASDTAQVMREYFRYASIEVKEDVRKEDIIEALYRGGVVMVPADGRALHNPYFTQPGPEEHMLVIIGYDPKTKEFITNDPGTKRGKGYRYGEAILYEAIRDYPTGNHKPIVKIEKSMIIVEKKAQ